MFILITAGFVRLFLGGFVNERKEISGSDDVFICAYSNDGITAFGRYFCGRAANLF